MYIVVLTNHKGGIGKTTLSDFIARGLALRGWRVLAIDGDPQGHLSLRLAGKKAPALHDLLIREANWNDLTVELKPERYALPGESLRKVTGELHVLPGDHETISIPLLTDRPETLAIRLEEMQDKIDVVVIDTSPTASQLHSFFYTAAHSILYPTELAFSSMDGLAQSIIARDAASRVRQSRWQLPAIHVAGIIPMKFRRGVNEQEENLKALKAQFGERVWSPISLRTLWTEAESRMLAPWSLDPYSDVVAEAFGLIDRVEQDMKRVESETYVQA
ncbi:MAG: hypothetical protein CL607_15110 [Anaerolineaceae bacterium]|nr:hypothetical protein [Anaerolineaceae bacterium]